MIGSTLSHFLITAKLGSGGMGEVYRAEDARLGREVAIKVLPAAFVADADRVARFDREARVLASLSHPNIAGIHEVGAAPWVAPAPPGGGGTEAMARSREEPGAEGLDGAKVHFLVMELASGETLAERISRGALPLDEALSIALQVAQALEAAHERGIVHRDLKPANVMVGPEGQVKVLDFGLARAMEPLPAPSGGPDLTNSPTLTHQGTRAGVLLGTAAYMSPEQAKGRPADRRADIWAFGIVLLEMLTGRRAFTAETLSETIAAVLTSEPDLAALPPEAPHRLRRLIGRCLRRDPRARLQAIGDARIVLEELARGEEADLLVAPSGRSRGGRWRAGLPWAVAALLVLVALWGLVSRPTGSGEASGGLRRLAVAGIAVAPSSGVAISPDGRELIGYDTRPGSPRLLRRSLDSFEVRPLPGAENAFNPFFSPDGRSVGFFSAKQLCVLPLEGGQRRCLAEADGFATGSWDEGFIVFTHEPPGEGEARGLRKVGVGGGEAATWLTRVDAAAGERAHGYPQVLPDGRHVLFTLRTEQDSLAVVPLAGGAPRVVLPGARRGRFVRSGHLVYEEPRTAALHAVPFDLATLEVSGGSVEVLRGLALTSDGLPAFEVSHEGTLVYSPAGLADEDFTVVAVERSGRVATLVGETASWAQPRVSPDGRAILLRRTQQPDCQLWLFDLGRRSLTRLTNEGDNHDPHWAAGGEILVFSRQSVAASDRRPFAQRLDGSDAAPFLTATFSALVTSLTDDGRFAALVHDDRRGRNDIFVHDRSTGETVPYAAGDADEDFATFSPDSRFLAFTSDETGRPEVYVRRFPGEGRKYPISVGGGTGALWSPDGREIFYSEGPRLMRVPVTTEPAFVAGAPELLFADPLLVWDRVRNYDVMPDGRSFVMVRRREGSATAGELRMVVGWFTELERLAPRPRG